MRMSELLVRFRFAVHAMEVCLDMIRYALNNPTQMRSNMKKSLGLSLAALAILFCAIPACAQTQAGAGSTGGHPDFSGIWYAPTPDISVALLPGQEISLTPYGAERYKKVDMANSPSYKCLPYGPVRAMQSTNPYM